MQPVAVVGQAPPSVPAEVPYARTRLYDWLASVGIEKSAFQRACLFAALVETFPGIAPHTARHRPPSRQQIKDGRAALCAFLTNASPRVVVTFGSLAAAEILNDHSSKLVNLVGRLFVVNPLSCLSHPIPVIPLPHPSGGSTWAFNDDHRSRLNEGLRLLAQQIDGERE